MQPNKHRRAHLSSAGAHVAVCVSKQCKVQGKQPLLLARPGQARRGQPCKPHTAWLAALETFKLSGEVWFCLRSIQLAARGSQRAGNKII